MSTQNSIKLSDYVEYPYLIPSIYLDFDIGSDYVVVESLMIIKPKSKESTELILQGNKIKLLSLYEFWFYRNREYCFRCHNWNE